MLWRKKNHNFPNLIYCFWSNTMIQYLKVKKSKDYENEIKVIKQKVPNIHIFQLY